MAELGWRDAIIQVLQAADEPMHYVAIADVIADQGIKKRIGATPATTVAATISLARSA